MEEVDAIWPEGFGEEKAPVECPYYAEHGHRPGRAVETIGYTCSLKGGHVSPWRDCAECPENGAAECAR